MRNRLVVLLFLIAPIFFITYPFFYGKTVFLGDNYSLMVPGKLFAANSIRSGILPFWNHLNLSGAPFIADISQSFWYPTTLLFLITKPALALNIVIFTHLIFASTGMYKLARYLKINRIGGMLSSNIWILSQPFIANVNNLAAIQSISYIPWLILTSLKLFDKKVMSWFWFVIVSFAAILSGYPQPLFYAGFLIVLLAMKSNKYAKLYNFYNLLSAGTVAILMSFLVIAPFIELAGLSTRSLINSDTVTIGSNAPLHLLQLIIPNIFTIPQDGIVWGIEWNSHKENSLYLGFSLLMLLGIGYIKIKESLPKYLKTIALFGIGSLFFSFGKYIPGFSWITQHVILLRLFRNPSGITIYWSFAISLLAGYWIPKILNKHHHIKHFPALLRSTFIIIALLYLTQNIWFAHIWRQIDELSGGLASASSFHTIDRDYVITKKILKSLLITSGLGVIIFTYSLWKRRSTKILIYTCLVVDVLFAAKPILFYAPNTVYDNFQLSKTAQWLQENLRPEERFLSLTGYQPWTDLDTYMQDIYIRPPFGESRYTNQEQTAFNDLQARRDSLVPNWNTPHNLPSINGYSTFVLTDTAKYWASSEEYGINRIERVPLDDLRLADQSVRYIVASKIFYTIHQPPSIANFPLAFENDESYIYQNENFRNYIRPLQVNRNFTISDLDVSGNQFSFTSQGDASDIEVATAYYPGWTCSIDGENCLVKQSETLSMIVPIPEGTHQTRLQFRPKNWDLYVLISIVSSTFFTGSWFISTRSRQSSTITADI